MRVIFVKHGIKRSGTNDKVLIFRKIRSDNAFRDFKVLFIPAERTGGKAQRLVMDSRITW